MFLSFATSCSHVEIFLLPVSFFFLRGTHSLGKKVAKMFLVYEMNVYVYLRVVYATSIFSNLYACI